MEPASPIPAALIEALRRKTEQDVTALQSAGGSRKDFALAVRAQITRPTPPSPKPPTLANTNSNDL